MFLGEYQHTLDAKGRVSLPSKFRSEITGSVVVTKGPETCLYVYTPEAHEQFVSKIVANGSLDPLYQQARRWFMSGSVPTELDSAGRLTLPQSLREHAHLGKDVVVIGNYDHIEVWDRDLWARYNSDTTGRIEDITRELSKEGVL